MRIRSNNTKGVYYHGYVPKCNTYQLQTHFLPSKICFIAVLPGQGCMKSTLVSVPCLCCRQAELENAALDGCKNPIGNGAKGRAELSPTPNLQWAREPERARARLAPWRCEGSRQERSRRGPEEP